MHKDRSTIFTVKISDLVQYVIFSQLILSTSIKKTFLLAKRKMIIV